MNCLIPLLFVLSMGAAQKSTRQSLEWDYKVEGEILNMYNKAMSFKILYNCCKFK